MARLYSAVKVSAFGKGPSNETEAQRKWLKARDTGCADLEHDKQPSCLLDLLNKRNEELAVAALFVRPELALDVLHRLDPKGAPLLEAVYLYGSEAPNADWTSSALAMKRQHLLALLQPYVQSFATEDDLSFGRDILKDDGILDASDALKSAKSFASFVAIASAYIPDGPVPRSVACAAIVRNPGLIEMEAPVFGSTLDRFIVSADCLDTLPPAPQLARLSSQITESWPNCDGTIRFAAYRTFENAIDAALLATNSNLSHKKSQRMPHLNGVSMRQVRAAIAELTSYYLEFGRASAVAASAIATARVRQIMASGHSCG